MKKNIMFKYLTYRKSFLLEFSKCWNVIWLTDIQNKKNSSKRKGFCREDMTCSNDG